MIEDQPKTVVGLALKRDGKDARPITSKFLRTRDCDPTDSCAVSCSSPDCAASCSSAACESAKDRK